MVDDDEYYVAYAPIETVGWRQLIFVNKEEADATMVDLLHKVDDASKETIWEYRRSFHMSSWLMIIVMVLILVNAAIVALSFSKRLTIPINRMTQRVREITGENLFFEMEDIYLTGDEIEILAGAFGDLSERTREYIDRITEITAEKERFGAELSVAAQIQQDMLPQVFPLYPEKTEVDVYASMDPAKEVGGDFFDIFLIDDDHMAFVMADVSGKGVPAALFMVISKTLIKKRTMMGGTPSEILYDVNNHLCDGNKALMFVTVWLGILTLSTGELLESNAGHEDPFLMKKKDGEHGTLYEQLIMPHDVFLGFMKNVEYNEDSFVLRPGDRLFIYTDGVPEATNTNGELYGMDRLGDVLNRNKDAEPKTLLSEVRKDVDAFVGDADQFDDLTMLDFIYHGEEGCGKSLKLTVPAVRDSHEAVRLFVDDELERVGCEIKSRRQINMAVDEIFTNVVSYAYPESEEGEVTVDLRYNAGGKEIEISFIDSGKPYDPLSQEMPDVEASGRERKAGGLGVFLVKKLMDDVRYEYKDGKNVLMIKKSFSCEQS
ncbi:SpoIIE family protein phosphatase [Butyrivibrio sp. YAB3001]|uniref:SpoIIE family protein phosphatase n=1 Tax=Butyrivibrio sp. YAB3001 TaxID=1520812 RepID=UPI0008F62DA4|nr:SpoIIE family protein phosphatase [Butyrivibrio sp. YAB3001]SFC79945.1 Serine phosphatase RsbU, regulator of sigma subunit [Butyrivibrio sp. YAB3001]